MSSQEAVPSGVLGGLDLNNARHSTVVTIVATLLAVLFTTRAMSGIISSKQTKQNGSPQTPTSHPYWIPFVGHALQMATGYDGGFLASLRERYPKGIFSLWMFGKSHIIIYKQSLGMNFLNKPLKIAENTFETEHLLLVPTFGVRGKDLESVTSLWPDLHAQYKYLLAETSLDRMVGTTVQQISDNIADFVTFNSYPADQMDWERLAGVDVVETDKQGTFVEANLMELTRSFVAKTANPALFGTDFVENFPDAWGLLWKFDEGFMALSTGVPAWLPYPRLQSAKSARSKLKEYFYEFNEAMDKHMAGKDPGPRWQDLDNVSDLIKARTEQYHKHSTPTDQRASLDVMLLWSMNTNANNLMPWMLFEIYRDPVLLAEVREEIVPFVKVTQPRNDFGDAVWIPPSLERLDVNGLLERCPLLKAAYIETLRVYSAPWGMRCLREEVVLEEGGEDGGSYLLNKGSYVHVPFEMHHDHPKHFSEPKEWQVDRHLKEETDNSGQKTRVADMGTIQPFGAGPGMCKGRNLAQRELLLYSAFIISFYDLTAPRGEAWPSPTVKKRVTTRYPAEAIKVWIKRREFAAKEEQA